MRKLTLGIMLVIGAFVGWVLIDCSHVFFNRFYDHNMYTMYFVVGCAIGLLFSYLIRERMELESCIQ